MIRIGPHKIDTNIFVAPLSGCSDLAFRLICREMGAGFCFFEMLDSHCVVRKRRGSFDILRSHEDDAPIAAQLLGSDPGMMCDAAVQILDHTKIKFLDINSACPVRKAIKKRSGAHLLREPSLLYKIVKTLSSSLSIPVTVKMRTGYDRKDPEDIAGIAKNCEDSGAAALFVHGRLASQGYSGEIDYESIKRIKESVTIPVFGMGNIFDGPSAAKMFEETSCDGIGIARGSLGNPWIFGEIDEYLKKGTTTKSPDAVTRKETLEKHLSYIHKYKYTCSSSKVGFMRKVALWYFKGFPGVARMRDRITRARSYDELIGIVG